MRHYFIAKREGSPYNEVTFQFNQKFILTILLPLLFAVDCYIGITDSYLSRPQLPLTEKNSVIGTPFLQGKEEEENP